MIIVVSVVWCENFEKVSDIFVMSMFMNGLCGFFFFKQKTAYEIGTGDWSSDVALPISLFFCLRTEGS